jgi:pyrroloquinoline quinone biosynthesis protein B
MNKVIARILGSAQDGGVPQVGCLCERCQWARMDTAHARFPASLAIVGKSGRLLLIDATPSLPQQLDLVRDLFPSDKRLLPDSVLLSHAHIGHYSGLMFFGKEVASTKAIPVYCTSAMKHFLESNKPFSYLIERNEIRIKELEKSKTILFDEDLNITPIEVPHRNEDADTLSFLIRSGRTLFYAPDFDHYTETIDRCVRSSDISVLDGCFWSWQEVSDRSYETILHPPIVETLERFKGLKNRIVFTHMNHTNPILNRDGRLRSELEKNGFRLAREGMDIPI